MSNFIKIRPMESEKFHTDRHDETKRLFWQFSERA